MAFRMVVAAQRYGESVTCFHANAAMRCPVNVCNLDGHLLTTRHAALMLSHPVPMRRGFKAGLGLEVIWC